MKELMSSFSICSWRVCHPSLAFVSGENSRGAVGVDAAFVFALVQMEFRKSYHFAPLHRE